MPTYSSLKECKGREFFLLLPLNKLGKAGVYAVYFAQVLSGELKKTFKCRPQYEIIDEKSGQNPSTDTSIVLLMEETYPVVMYEYKPVVHQDYFRIDIYPQ